MASQDCSGGCWAHQPVEYAVKSISTALAPWDRASSTPFLSRHLWAIIQIGLVAGARAT